MAHKRKQIRDQIKSDLTGLTTTGSNVFKSRVYPMDSASLPGLIIYTVEEDNERRSMGGSLLRFLTVAVEAFVKAAGGSIDDTLDTIASEVEAAMNGNRKINDGANDLAMDSYLMGTEIEFDAESEKPVGRMVLKYMIEYQTG